MNGKAVLGFMADVLYIKGIIKIEEFDAIMDCIDEKDLGAVTEGLLRGEYNGYKKGEAYTGYAKL